MTGIYLQSNMNDKIWISPFAHMQTIVGKALNLKLEDWISPSLVCFLLYGLGQAV